VPLNRRGLTLVECLAGMVVAGVLTAAAGSLLLATSRLVRSEAAALSVRRNVRTGAAVLRAELSAVSADSGDLLAVSDSAVLLRAARGFGALCATPAGSRVVLDDSLLSLWRAIDPSRDSVRIFVAGDPLSAADDHWARAGIAATGRGACLGGGSGTAFDLVGVAAADLSLISAGAPLGFYEVVEYRRYRDATGAWMLGVRSPLASGGWAASSPIAGPLLPGASGLSLRALDAAGAVVVTPADARIIEITVRGVAAQPLASGVSPRDSVTVLVSVSGAAP
jgi:prepilin-type N-terminal cleavage/methylation domain-containing protein